jgi:hypothetical protein
MAGRKIQTYANHGHLPVPSTVAFTLAATAGVATIGRWVAGWHVDTLVLSCLSGATFVLALTSRTYTTRLQDRIIRLEMRVRLKELLPRERHALIDQLTPSQLVGLRFASDAELPALAARAAADGLSRDQIKKAITDWQPDWMRT